MKEENKDFIVGLCWCVLAILAMGFCAIVVTLVVCFVLGAMVMAFMAPFFWLAGQLW